MAKILIVGAGPYGCTVARALTDAGHQCRVIERRDHIGGNCFTQFNEEAGCHQHVYGAHIFHTQETAVWGFVNRFGEFNRYTHRVRAFTAQGVLPVPVNLDTLNRVYGVTTPEQARARLAAVCHKLGRLPENAEEHCLATIGPDLYRLLIRDYTIKQWNRHPSQLPASIVGRLPVRFTFEDTYFGDPFQGIPVEGYTDLFQRMLGEVPVELGADFCDQPDYWLARADHVVYSGPIDQWFGYTLGPLDYRSLRFETRLFDTPDLQGVAVMNCPQAAVPWTRRIEHKHFHAARGSRKTLVTEEFPQDGKIDREAFYPVNTPENEQRYSAYALLAKQSRLHGRVTFGGRLGRYRYYDMDQVIASGLQDARQLALKMKP